MDGFTYYNIFETKGIEYIIIITFLLLLVPFWLFVNKQKAFSLQIQHSLGVLNAAILQISKGVFYSKNHTWAQIDKSGTVDVGIDNWLLTLTGNATFRHLKTKGDTINKGDLMTEIESNGKVLQIFSPISGNILNINKKASKVSQLITSNPYADGWLYKFKPTQWKSETSQLYLGNNAKNWFKQELERFKDFVAVSLGKNAPLDSMLVLQEGGELLNYSLDELSEAVWTDFQNEFLNN